MRTFLVAMGSAAALALGCTSVVTEPGQTSGTTTGSGGASTTTSTTTGFGGGFTTSTGTGGAPLCDASTLFVDVEGDVPLEHFDGSCLPMGSVIWQTGPKPPPPPPKTPPPPGVPGVLTILACSVKQQPTLQLGGTADTWPASIGTAYVSYFHGGALYTNDPADGLLDVTLFEPTGGVIEGTFTAVVTRQGPGSGPMTLKLFGKFRVCHGPDSFTV